LQREVLRLQRAIGNRAVARFGLPTLARQPAGPATASGSKLMFIAIMALKGQTFATAQDSANALNSTSNKYAALLKTIDYLYDSSGETNHRAYGSLSFGPPRKPPAQAKWEGYLKRARTEERNPQVTAPDGATYKVELADILRGAGHQI
jgi:hypothetical protein